MSISTPTINFPLDEVLKRINFVKSRSAHLSQVASDIQKEIRLKKPTSDLEEINLIQSSDKELGLEIIKMLVSGFPKDNILCEDRELIENSSDFSWIIDPVDGTMNFVRGIPLYAIAIGLEHRQTPVGGVVIVPDHELVYSAVLGEGATKNGAPISTSNVNSLNRAIFSPNLPTKRAQMIQEIMADLSGFLTYARSFRRTGSFVLDCCWIAEGLMDAIWEKSVKHWDVAAASIILTEAGGKLTDLSGKHYLHGLPELVASNGILHSEILNLLRTVRSSTSRN